ncbi:MAG: zinc ribbon domain-containing protein, partial [Ilumatobacteraceae bacterium]|nr:zinc ribbon domain-containing protein [Ilumatobacteraceae bacterium]
NAWWFDALQAGELRVQRCADCSTLRHPPGPMCPTCSSLRWDSVAAPASGTIHSLAVVHYPVVPSFEYPLPVVLVDLDGLDGPDGTAGTAGIRMIMNTADSEPASVVIGARVRIEVRDADDPSIDGAARLPFAIVENPS